MERPGSGHKTLLVGRRDICEWNSKLKLTCVRVHRNAVTKLEVSFQIQALCELKIESSLELT